MIRTVGLRAKCMGSNPASATCCVILGKLLNLPVLLCSHLEKQKYYGIHHMGRALRMMPANC